MNEDMTIEHNKFVLKVREPRCELPLGMYVIMTPGHIKGYRIVFRAG